MHIDGGANTKRPMAQPTISILIVDDDLSSQSMFQAVMKKAGYTVDLASNATDAAALCEVQVFNLAIVALKSSGPPGLDLVRRIKDLQPECAIVMTSHNPSREELIEALRLRVDDFLIKPVSGDIIRRTVGEVLLKHPARRSTPTDVVAGDLRIDANRRIVYWHGQVLTLTPTEYCVLLALAQQADHLVSASLLAHRCRGHSVGETDARQLIKPHIANLRKKLEQNGRYKRVLLSHRERGYILNLQAQT
jgi:DNA-binding response OmpR family regulator